MGISGLGGTARTLAPGRHRVRAWYVVAGCIAGVLTVQTMVLLAVPDGWRMVVSSLLTLIVFVGWFLICARVIRRRRRVAMPALSTSGAARSDDLGDQQPSERMRLACELARLGAPAVWIAAQCDLPMALAELIITDVRGGTIRGS